MKTVRYSRIHDWTVLVLEAHEPFYMLEMRPWTLEFGGRSEHDLYEIARYFEEYWTSGTPLPACHGFRAADGRGLYVRRVRWVRSGLRVYVEVESPVMRE